MPSFFQMPSFMMGISKNEDKIEEPQDLRKQFSTKPFDNYPWRSKNEIKLNELARRMDITDQFWEDQPEEVDGISEVLSKIDNKENTNVNNPENG
jgi:hypothetical protein